MAFGTGNTRVRLAQLCLTTILANGAAFPAYAQSDPEASPPSVYQPVDERGVDVFSGTFNFDSTDVSIGDMAFVRSFRGNGFRDSFRGGVSTTTPSGNIYRVSVGGSSETFTLSGVLGSGTFSQNEGSGSTLTFASGTFTYNTRDGMTYALSLGGIYPNSITSPDGTVDSFYTKTINWCRDIGDACLPRTSTRLQQIRRSSGYALKFDYASNVIPAVNASQWLLLNKVTAFNMGTDSCGALTDTCSFTQTWPSVSYAAATVGTNTVRTSTDALARTTTYTFNGSSQLTAIKRPASVTDNVTIGYSAGKVQSLNVDGANWTYGFSDSAGTRTTTITDPIGQSRTFTSNLTIGRITSYTDPTSKTTSFAYDGLGRLTRTTQAEGNYSENIYDARSNITQTVRVAKPGSGLANITTTASFDATCTNFKTCNSPNSTTDALGNATNYTYDATTGLVTSIKLPAATSGAVRPEIRLGYSGAYAWYKNDAGTIVQAVAPIYQLITSSACQTTASCAGTASEAKTTIVYQAGSAGTASNLLPAVITSGAGDGSVSATYTLTHDLVGNRSTIDGPLAGSADTTRLRYDAASQLVGVVEPDPDGAGVRKLTARKITYNANGQITLSEIGVVDDASDVAWAAFSSQEQVATTYDANARPVRAELKAGGTTYALSQTSYDTSGRVDCSTQRMNPAAFGSLPASACSLGTVGSHGPDRISKTSYDAAGRVTKVQTAYGTAQQADEMVAGYTNNGRTGYVIDAENNRTAYTYDGHDRLWATEYPSAAKGANSVNTLDNELLTYDANGNVTSRKLRDGGSIGYGYDNLNRLVSKNLPGSEPDATYGYDLMGMPLSAVQDGQTLTFTYDALGRKTGESIGYIGTTTFAYDAAGRRTSVTYPGSALTINYDHDVLGNITAIRENGAGSGVGVLASYAFDNLGRRTSVTFGNGSVQSFAYDPVSRLSTLTNDLNGGATTHDLTQSFTFNPASQIASATRGNDAYAWGGHYNVDRNYTANGLNQLTAAGSTSLGYDARGNLTSSGGASYSYNSENMMTSGPGSTALAYDPVGRLKYKVGSGFTNYYGYDGVNLITELDPWGTPLRRYVHGPGTDNPIVWYEGNAINSSTRRFLMADERGSIVSVTDSSNATIAINSYDEYGIPASGNVGRFGYTGQTWLPEVGLWYYKARMYSPTLGRFMQTDPIGYNGGMNWYNYVGSDPVNSTDPMGLARVYPEIVVTGTRSFGFGASSLSGSVGISGAAHAEFLAAQIEAKLDSDIVVNGTRPVKTHGSSAPPAASTPQNGQPSSEPVSKACGTHGHDSPECKKAKEEYERARKRWIKENPHLPIGKFKIVRPSTFKTLVGVSSCSLVIAGTGGWGTAIISAMGCGVAADDFSKIIIPEQELISD